MSEWIYIPLTPAQRLESMKIYTEKDHVSLGWLAQNEYDIVDQGSDENGAWIEVKEE